MKHRKYRVRESMEAYTMLLPMILGMIFISVGAILGAFTLSFTDYSVKWPPNFVGLRNYIDFFTHPLFWKVLGNSLYYVLLTTIPTVVLALLLALLLDNHIHGAAFFRAAIFWPVVASMTAVSLIWSFLLNNHFGLVNLLLSQIGIKGPKWLGDTRWTIVSLALIFVWKWVGYYMTIFLGGLQNIPVELHESATLDGAGYWKRVRHITLPMLSPTLFFVLIMVIIAGFQVFDQILVITKNGGPNYSTLTLSFYIYQNAFEWGKMGYACAMGIVLFTIVSIFSLIQFKMQDKWVFYE